MNYEYCDGVTHAIKQGETLYSLSRQYKVPLAILLRANPYIDVYNLKIGDTICVPVKRQGQGNGSCQGMVCGGMAVMPRAGGQDEDTGMDMEENMPEDAGMDMDMGRSMPEDAGMDMRMGRSMPEDAGMDMDTGRSMPEDAGMDMDTGRSMQEDTELDMGREMPEGGMNMRMGRGMYGYGNSMENSNNMMGRNREDTENQDNCWIKYVAQAGDTLQDIYDRSACSKEMFWDKNRADRMYMLPGVAYFILENDVD